MTHHELCARARKWLYENRKCKFAISEIESGYRERPDAIGFWDRTSMLIECKTTRSDFKADASKPFRQCPEKGLGDYRYYMCPKGLIDPREVPELWGLLWVTPLQVRTKKEAPLIKRPLENKFVGEMKILTSMVSRARWNFGRDFEKVMRYENYPQSYIAVKKNSNDWYAEMEIADNKKYFGSI